MPATVPGDLVTAINSGAPAPAGLAGPEREAFDSLSTFFGRNAAYGAIMVTRPETIGYSLADSPSGLAAWMYEKFAQWSDSGGVPERVLSKDEMLNDITLYWLTNTGASSSRFYWENNNNNFSAVAQKTKDIKVPVAISVFPHEIYRAPKSWSEQAYPSLYYFTRFPKAVTSRPGNSHNSLRKSCARRSSQCVNRSRKRSSKDRLRAHSRRRPEAAFSSLTSGAGRVA